MSSPTQDPAGVAAATQLNALRHQARAAADHAYEDGPGRRQAGSPKPQSEIARKRARKTRSAYTSRFHAKIYSGLLEARCAAALAEAEQLRRRRDEEEREARELRWTLVQMENEVLRRQIAELRREAGEGCRPPVGSPVSEGAFLPLSGEEVRLDAGGLVELESPVEANVVQDNVCQEAISDFDNVISEIVLGEEEIVDAVDDVVDGLADGVEGGFVDDFVGHLVDEDASRSWEGDVTLKVVNQVLDQAQTPVWGTDLLEYSAIASTQVA